MPTFVLPQSSVFAARANVAAVAARPLRAHISGLHAALVRYNKTAERESGLLGYYDPTLATDYVWPNQPADSLIDLAYTKIWLKNALLRYFSVSASGGDVITKTANYNNRIRSDVLSFTTNTDSYPRSATFYDRDVKVGDIVKVRAVNTDGDPVTLWTSIRQILGDDVAATVAAVTADASNVTTQELSTAITQVAGAVNCVTLVADASSYQGLPSGYVTETYDLLVTEGSVDGDYTTAVLRVISGSGTDDDSSVIPAAAGLPTTIGTRGLLVTINEADTAACSASADVDDVPADDLIVGQRFRVTVIQDFDPATATSGGTYDGSVDVTYVVTVSRGGLFGAADTADQPQIAITTLDGTDLSGPTTVVDVSTDVAVGTHGVLISFTGLGLRKGDRYDIVATAVGSGAMKTLVLNNNLSSDIADDTLVDLDLFILAPTLAIPEDRDGFAPITNWSANRDTITLAAGIIAYDSTWTDDGTELPLPVIASATNSYGKAYVEYRAWLPTLTRLVIGSTANGTDAEIAIALDLLISGALDPDNPLKWGVYMALRNSNGTEVKFTAVMDDTLIDWADAVATVVGRDDVYGLVPLTQNRDVLTLYQAHAIAMSADEVSLWRHVLINIPTIPLLPLVTAGSSVPGYTAATTLDGAVCLATITDDPNTTGTQYTLVVCDAGNAEFITNGVRAGDTLRTNYVNDGFGNYTYSSYTVVSVISNDELLLVSGPSVPVNTAAKIEVWRTLTAVEEATAIAAQAAHFASPLVEIVWPDFVIDGVTTMAGYHVCAALAGLASAILPHQSLTRLQVVGMTDVSRSYRKFLPAQLDIMRDAGIWIVTQDPVSGDVYTRDAVTSVADQTDLLNADEMCVRNLHSIRYRFKETFDVFKGATNVVDVVRHRLNIEVVTLVAQLKSEAYNSNLGAQLVSGTLTTAPHRHAVFKNRWVVTMDLSIPVTTDRVDATVNVVIG